MAQGLHSEKMWEELAEDPFRGLRAGPATFSPFLSPAKLASLTRLRKTFRDLKTLVADVAEALRVEQTTKSGRGASFARSKRVS
jgi:hypothetical protein